MNITKIILGACCCFLIVYSCNDSASPIPNETFFNGSINGENREGNGVVFLDEQGHAELIRIIAGNEQFLQQIDISLDAASSGTYKILENQASVSEVFGLDAVSKIENSIGNSNDFVTLQHLEGFVEGGFSFEVLDNSSSSKSLTKGQFRFEASSSRNWNCNFESDSVSYCYFLD